MVVFGGEWCCCLSLSFLLPSHCPSVYLCVFVATCEGVHTLLKVCVIFVRFSPLFVWMVACFFPCLW